MGVNRLRRGGRRQGGDDDAGRAKPTPTSCCAAKTQPTRRKEGRGRKGKEGAFCQQQRGEFHSTSSSPSLSLLPSAVAGAAGMLAEATSGTAVYAAPPPLPSALPPLPIPSPLCQYVHSFSAVNVQFQQDRQGKGQGTNPHRPATSAVRLSAEPRAGCSTLRTGRAHGCLCSLAMAPRSLIVLVTAAASLASRAEARNNLSRTPPMGWSACL